MDATCNQDFLNKGCVCLSDPLDPWANICAYIDRQTGLVYPCNPGCCVPKCGNLGQSQNLEMELHRTGGVALPEGFGVNLGSGGGTGASTGTPILPHQSKISSTQQNDFGGSTPPKDVKVWELLVKLAIFLVIIFLAAGFLD
jgi:hypothetical protein